MITEDQAREVLGRDLVGPGGDKIGKVGQIFLDDETGQPEWVTVQTGLFGTKESFVPLADASTTADGLAVPYDKDKIKGAPNIDVEAGHLSREEEADLYSYYGLPYSTDASESVYAETGTAQTTGTPAPAAATGNKDEITLAEERLRVGTQRVESGRVRLRKFVTTEQVSTSVPVTREEVRIQREPIAGGTTSGTATLGNEEVEVVLHEERPVIQKDVVATERIRVDVDQVTENVQVSDTVRKEDVEVVQEGGTDTGRTI